MGLLFAVIIIIAVLHGFAAYFHLYWQLAWFDRVLHPLGGLWIGLVTMYLLSLKVRAINKGAILIICLVAALVIGGLWEIFELAIGVTNLT
jgi:hypothetical protein